MSRSSVGRLARAISRRSRNRVAVKAVVAICSRELAIIDFSLYSPGNAKLVGSQAAPAASDATGTENDSGGAGIDHASADQRCRRVDRRGGFGPAEGAAAPGLRAGPRPAKGAAKRPAVATGTPPGDGAACRLRRHRASGGKPGGGPVDG